MFLGLGLGEGAGHGVGTSINRKLTHDFWIPLNTNFALSAAVWPEFQCQFITLPPIRPQFVGLGWTILFDFHAQYRLNLHRLSTIHNAADVIEIGTGCLCYSIGGLKTRSWLLRPLCATDYAYCTSVCELNFLLIRNCSARVESRVTRWLLLRILLYLTCSLGQSTAFALTISYVTQNGLGLLLSTLEQVSVLED